MVLQTEVREHLDKVMQVVMAALEVLSSPPVGVAAQAQQVKRARPKSAAPVVLD
jgi:hypothetical protein